MVGALLALTACGPSEATWRARIPAYLPAGELVYRNSIALACDIAVFAIAPEDLVAQFGTDAPAALAGRLNELPMSGSNYEPWRQTPLPDDTSVEVSSFFFNRACLEHTPRLREKFDAGAYYPGGLYLTNGRADFLLLLPDHGLIFLGIRPH